MIEFNNQKKLNEFDKEEMYMRAFIDLKTLLRNVALTLIYILILVILVMILPFVFIVGTFVSGIILLVFVGFILIGEII